MRKFLHRDCEKILDKHIRTNSASKIGKRLRKVYFDGSGGGCQERDSVQTQLEAMCFAVNQLGAFHQKHPIKLKKPKMLEIIYSMTSDVQDTVCSDLTGWAKEIRSLIPED